MKGEEGLEKKVIIHVTITFKGGVGNVIKHLINYQLKQGYKVGIAFKNGDDIPSQEFLKDLIGHVDLYPINTPAVKGFNTFFGIPINYLQKKLSLKYSPNNTFFHFHNASSIGVFNKLSSLKMLCTIHGKNSGSILSKFIYKLILKRITSKNIHLVYISHYIKNHFENIYNSQKCSVIYNGITKIDKDENKAVHDLKDKFIIGYAAFLTEQKGWRLLYNAYKSLPQKYKEEIVLLFAGEGNDSQLLMDFIKEDNLEEKVKYIGQIQNAVSAFIPFLDTFIQPSKEEGFGLTVIESFSHGIPVIASNSGAMPELIKDGWNGLLIDRNEKDLARKIITLFENKNLYTNLSKRGYNNYINQFTSDNMGRQYDEVYKEILKSKET